ncbi:MULTISPECIES: hypothetical protein [unclassified Lysobacter]|uniref:hypothetical protein n=1 Tax=unclassified Lysobacter TaxID=2635362 RepID=UPI001BEBF53C|nr:MULTISPECIES: hypothetical protein [unclassified Lysobacter]MBT2745713.1 hypothetical protein [Lysobacter sp. ISL-42]MBT2749728.1 hypothetical protein [Lysobacter sp. ISL-50]MBT2777553.1 hypothetical protein [Lysobacter sp. ISL-54]MBT2782041.1 hypothetical protein [Lysobacter sp. ISL-52]
MATVHQTMIQSVGPKYRDSHIESWSYYRHPIDQAEGRAAGNSHVWSDASPEVQSQSIDALIAASEDDVQDTKQWRVRLTIHLSNWAGPFKRLEPPLAARIQR